VKYVTIVLTVVPVQSQACTAKPTSHSVVALTTYCHPEYVHDHSSLVHNPLIPSLSFMEVHWYF